MNRRSKKWKIAARELPVLYGLPRLLDDYGFSIWKDVIVLWDEDYDRRVLIFIDQLPEYIRQQLVFVHESEGSINLWWTGEELPEGFEEGKFVDVGLDSWLIHASISILPKE